MRGFRFGCPILEEQLDGIPAASELMDPEYHLGGRLLRWELSGRKTALPREIRSINETVNTSGGYLTPNDLLGAWFISRLVPEAQIPSLGPTIIPITSDRANIATHSSGPTWITHTEMAEETEASIVFGSQEWNVETRMAWFGISREWLQDAVGGLPLLEQVLISEAAVDLDAVCLVGGSTTGSPGVKPPGLTTLCTSNAVSVAGAITYAKLFSALEAVREDNVQPNGLVWHPTIQGDVAQLTVNGESNHFLPSMPEPLASIPQRTTTAATTALAFLGDFRKLYIGLRQGLEFQVEQKAASNSIRLGCTYRVALNVSHEPAISVLSGITT
jgi:HK97 family phage major capsid protein